MRELQKKPVKGEKQLRKMVKRVSSYRCHHVTAFLFLFYSYPPFYVHGAL